MERSHTISRLSNDSFERLSYETTHDTLTENNWNDAPPPYTLIAGDGNTITEDDGRVRLDVDSKLARTLSIFIKDAPEQSPPDHQDPALEKLEQPPPLNILIQIVGSRGDVQPFIGLGNELQKFGHRVRLATHGIFRDFVTTSGLEFYPIGGDPNELMAYMVKNPGLIPSMKNMRAGEITNKRTMIREMLEGCWRSCITPDESTGAPFIADAIIANPPSFAHIHCAQALCIPVHSCTPHVYDALDSNEKLPSSVGQLNDWRETIDLEPVPTTEGPFLAYTQNIPTTYCWSAALVPKPQDWGQHIDVCGFFFRDMPAHKPPQDLQDFLDAGPTPIYIGFGSIVLEDPEKKSIIIAEAVKNTGVRCILSKGWGGLSNVHRSPNIFELGDCPHEWLFQHVSAVVHHGGAGTAACGLKHGPRPIHHKSLTAEKLGDGINFLTTPEARHSARQIAQSMLAEDGVKAAVHSFHRNLPRDTVFCDILPQLPAVWTYKVSSKQTIKLSKLAAEVLVDRLKIDPKKLGMNEIKTYHITNRRWDPITGAASATIGTVYRSGMAIGGGFKEKRASNHDDHLSVPGSSTSRSRSRSRSPRPTKDLNEADNRSIKTTNDLELDSKKLMSGGNRIARGFGKAGNTILKGGLVDIPFALAEGLRNAPAMYGDKPRDLGPVTDWKSGGVAAGKGLFFSIYDGVAGLVTEPVKGAKQEGALGALKGFGKGLGGMYWKPNAGLAGLLGYTMQGIYKSVYSAIHTGTRKSIAVARRKEGAWLLARSRDDEALDLRDIVTAFEELKKKTASCDQL
ncbi:UDP-Glycosyltransferase/glycogen phosphorylase [Aureobasidium sp. EXF-12298]|nr:UDP-Glycosyltransferase/glycogen phosphorylase [Aureobasidium sp. EXF-12298]KAI4756606.1 UDP-Glycosyltransferase/glycogen phosphorylase [Aureobasidium sp. EXF-12344]